MSDARRRRGVSNDIEETFSRYEEGGETPPASVQLDEEPADAPKVAIQEQVPSIHPTQIRGLDNLIGGGLPSNSLILVTGNIGSNYSTFIEQILFKYLSSDGKVAFYTSETPSREIEREMESFNWSINRHLESGKWVFIDVLTPDLQSLAELAPEGFNNLRVNLSGSLSPLKTDILDKVKENRWTVINLSHMLHTYDLKEVMELLLYWRTVAKTFGGIHFALLPQDVHPEQHVNALKNLADGVIEFQLREGQRDYESFISFQKLRTLRKARRLQFNVTEEGIVIETAERIR